jgi:hypothetical protein
MSNTAQGAGVGGLLGAGLGTAVGAATHNPLAGAAIGGLTGAAVGGAIGNEKDMQERAQRDRDLAVAQSQAAQAQARPSPLGITDVQRLAASRVDDNVIINQIRTTGSTFNLSAADIEWLKTNGVSDAVIFEMQNARPRPVAVIRQPAVVYTDPPPYYYYRPYYYGPPVGFSYGYVRFR